jgi:hypothetical protein
MVTPTTQVKTGIAIRSESGRKPIKGTHMKDPSTKAINTIQSRLLGGGATGAAPPPRAFARRCNVLWIMKHPIAQEMAIEKTAAERTDNMATSSRNEPARLNTIGNFIDLTRPRSATADGTERC